jgi:hypothetical protein
MAKDMGIGKLGLTQGLLFKRKFRWLFQVDGINGGGKSVPPDYVKVASRPNISFEETEINFLHGKMYIPGKATFETVSVTYYDVAPVKSDTILYLYDWIGSVYDFLGRNGNRINPKMSTNASGPGGYAATGTLTMLDGGGLKLESWYLYDCWPQSVNFGDLDYSSNEEATLELTLRYQFAKWENFCGEQPNPGFSPGCGV